MSEVKMFNAMCVGCDTLYLSLHIKEVCPRCNLSLTMDYWSDTYTSLENFSSSICRSHHCEVSSEYLLGKWIQYISSFSDLSVDTRVELISILVTSITDKFIRLCYQPWSRPTISFVDLADLQVIPLFYRLAPLSVMNKLLGYSSYNDVPAI